MEKFKLEDMNTDFVENLVFSTKLILCVDKIQKSSQQKCEEASDNLENMKKFFTEKDKMVDKIYWDYRAILSCLQSINYSIYFVKNYNKRDYLRKEYIPFNEFCLYHYDVVCHKIATLKDLYFKIVDKLYSLNLEKATWTELEKKEQIINNERLFEILRENFRVSKYLEEVRHKSSHEGRITLSLLESFDIIQTQVFLREHTMLPESEKEELCDRKSFTYHFEVLKTQGKILEFLYRIKNNSFILTRELFISLTCQLCVTLRELYPNELFELNEDKACPQF